MDAWTLTLIHIGLFSLPLLVAVEAARRLGEDERSDDGPTEADGGDSARTGTHDACGRDVSFSPGGGVTATDGRRPVFCKDTTSHATAV